MPGVPEEGRPVVSANSVIKYLEEQLASAQSTLKMQQEWVVESQKLVERLEACLADVRKTESLAKALEAIDG